MSTPKWRQPGGKGYLRPSTSESLVGVTTLIKMLDASPDALIGWARKVAAEVAIKEADRYKSLLTDDEKITWVKREAAKVGNVKRDIGTAVHDLIELELRGEAPAWPDSVRQYRDGFESFVEETGFSVGRVEQTVMSDLGYGGTYDCDGQVNGDVIMVDWKTGSIRPTAAAQMSLYNAADVIVDDDGTETEFGGADLLWVVQIVPGDYEVHQVKPLSEEEGLALASDLMRVWKWGGAIGTALERLPAPVRVL